MSKKNTRRAGQRQSSTGLWPWLLIGAAAVILAGITGFIVWRQAADQPPADFTPAVTGGPSAKVSQTAFDYGDVKLGTTITTQFDIENVGDSQLVIAEAPRVEVREGC